MLGRVMARVAHGAGLDCDHAACLADDTAWATGRATPDNEPAAGAATRRSGRAEKPGVALPVAQVCGLALAPGSGGPSAADASSSATS